jgi:alkanesulfonate monooxygenase SsuD/methylene tetrahydromethanopterin reductase-like flavin-dependent oxidoreductase (luciferase family)
VLASFVAARTKTLRLGMGVSLLPLHHPMDLAEELAVLDVVSGGRLDVGIGRGGDPGQGEWKGATVLAGSAIEALLLWKLQEHEAQHRGDLAGAGATLLAAKKLSAQPHGNPSDGSCTSLSRLRRT